MLEVIPSWFMAGYLVTVLVISAFALYQSLRSRVFAEEAVQWIQDNNEHSMSLRELGTLNSELTELKDSYMSLLASHKKLRSRIGMRELRERRKNGEEDPKPEHDENQIDAFEPDPQKDPEAWKRYMRAKLRLGVNK